MELKDIGTMILFEGFGPAYGGDEFLRLKEIPPAVVAARTSGRSTCELVSPSKRASHYLATTHPHLGGMLQGT